MIRLGLVLMRSGGWPRMLLVAGCTAVVSGLLLVAVALLRLPPQPQELLFSLVAQPGTRGGTAFATTLLTVPPLLLLYQAVRLGTAARERRLAALRLAGATPAEVRGLGAIEVGLPALVGGALGVGVYGLLRWTMGGSAWSDRLAPAPSVPEVRLVPTTVAPAWWQVCLVVGGVAVLGVVVGLLASRRTMVSPLGVTRRHTSAPPRPWGLLLLLAAALLVPLSLTIDTSEVVGMGIVGLAVIGIVSLAPWVAYRVGRLTESRARSAAMLLAARRLVADPRPVGRAAAAVGGIALVSGGAGAIAADLAGMPDVDSFYVVSLALVALALLAALVVATGTLAVHSVESLLDRKRSIAALAALGTPTAELERSQRLEATLVAGPMALLGVLLGSAAVGGLAVERSSLGATVMLLNVVITPALVWLAIFIAVRATRPWLLRAGALSNLRTE